MKKNFNEFIVQSHRFRDQLLEAIVRGDQEKVKAFDRDFQLFIQEDQLRLTRRIDGNELRSLKNLMVSHNTLYGYIAEKGGMHPADSHYMTEKYSIIIESASTTCDLLQVHTEMLLTYSDLTNRRLNPSNDSISFQIADFINSTFQENYTVKEIAAEFNVNRSHLMRQFKKDFGLTITQFRNKRRVEVARDLLIYSDLPLTEVAHLTGFSSSQYFSKIFNHMVGCAPGLFRQQNRLGSH